MDQDVPDVTYRVASLAALEQGGSGAPRRLIGGRFKEFNAACVRQGRRRLTLWHSNFSVGGEGGGVRGVDTGQVNERSMDVYYVKNELVGEGRGNS